MTKLERTKLCIDYLVDEGYRPHLDDDGGLSFKCEGGTYWLLVPDDDDEYYQLVYPGFWPIEDVAELTRAQAAAERATRDVKVAKVFLCNEQRNVSATIEAFHSSPEGFQACFARNMRALGCGVATFAVFMQASS